METSLLNPTIHNQIQTVLNTQIQSFNQPSPIESNTHNTIINPSGTSITDTNIQSHHSIHLKLITELKSEQESLESNLITKRNLLLKQIELKENEIQVNELVQDQRLEQSRMDLKSLQVQLSNWDLNIYNELEQLRVRQQLSLQQHGVPLFKVSNSLVDIRNQVWVLSPYLHEISK
ncbi:hypothetical protein BC833DRAFT_617667 [Globomyces pollinis-pini]|nr:hypothetical protein BC833DRAFT_617667 [Globomyces pollinis-pini]